jgi:hypothetical protein
LSVAGTPFPHTHSFRFAVQSEIRISKMASNFFEAIFFVPSRAPKLFLRQKSAAAISPTATLFP